jgi:hypothetical protein
MYATRECIIKLVKEVTSLIKSGEIQKVFDGLSFTFISDHLVCKSELCIGKDIVVVKGTSNMSSYTGPVLISCSEEEIDQKLLSLCNKEVTIYTELSCEDGNTEIVKAGSSLDDMKELVLKRVYNNYVVYKIPYQLIVSDSQNKIIISTLESRA